MAPTFKANFNPSVAPLDKASIKLTPSVSLFTRRFLSSFSGFSSGRIIFEITIAAGAFMIEALSR